jgi:hypothetical protein
MEFIMKGLDDHRDGIIEHMNKEFNAGTFNFGICRTADGRYYATKDINDLNLVKVKDQEAR